jgi:hypothetical protein
VKTLQLIVRGKPVTVSTDRVKPTYVLNETDRGGINFNPSAKISPATAPPGTPPPLTATQTTRSGRHIRFNT